MNCRVCGDQFSPTKNHPGYINVCLDSECRTLAKEPVVRAMTVSADALVTFDTEIDI